MVGNGMSFAEAKEIVRNSQMRAVWEAMSGITLPQSVNRAVDIVKNITAENMPEGWEQRGRYAGAFMSEERTAEDRSGQERTAEDRSGQERTAEDRSGQERTGRFSIKADAVDKINAALTDKNIGGDIQLTDTTPGIMVSQRGVKNLPLVMDVSHIRENILTEEEADALGLATGTDINYHGLGVELFTNVINDLENVTLAYRGTKNAFDPTRGSDYFLLISQYKDQAGNVINVPVYINQTKGVNRVVINANVLATVFGRKNFNDYIQRELSNGNLVRIKNRGPNGSKSPAPIAVDYADVTSVDEAANQAAMASYDESVSQSTEKSNTQNGMKSMKVDSEGNSLTAEQQDADPAEGAMTMQQMKRVLEAAFNALGIKKFGDYMTAAEWLAGEGARDIAMELESDYDIYMRYFGNLEGIQNDEYMVEDIVQAYVDGRLKGAQEQRPVRLDTGKSYGSNDTSFYAPRQINVDPAQTWQTANQKLNNSNRAEVTEARKQMIFISHSGYDLGLIGINQTELNKKLKQWANYSAQAVNVSNRFNADIPIENQWTGIQNCSVLNKAGVTAEDIGSVVKSITGESNEYQRNYIGRALLALDTHINWSDISFVFSEGFADPNRRSVRGLYSRNTKTVTIGKVSGASTVAHEMGHALDGIWHSDLFGETTSEYLTETRMKPELINDADARQFYRNFQLFIKSLNQSADISSGYTQKNTETFARFVAKFVEWADIQAGNRFFAESGYFQDKFTASQYIEFVKLLQEKAMLDNKKAAERKAQGKASLKKTSADSASPMTAEEAAAAVQEAKKVLSAETRKLRQQVEYWKGQTRRTKEHTVRSSDVKAMARRLIDDMNSDVSTEEIAGMLQKLGDYLVQHNGNELHYYDLKNIAVRIAVKLVDNAQEVVDETAAERQKFVSFLRGLNLKITDDTAGNLREMNVRQALRGRVAALTRPRRVIHSRSRSIPLLLQYKSKNRHTTVPALLLWTIGGSTCAAAQAGSRAVVNKNWTHFS